MSYFEGTNYQAKKHDAGLPMFSKVETGNRITNIEKLESGRILIHIIINDIEFTRISTIDLKNHIIWTDVNSHFGQRDLMSKEKENELESIFLAIASK